jgi:hypothetical protein
MTLGRTDTMRRETFEKRLFTYLHELFDPSTGLLTKS